MTAQQQPSSAMYATWVLVVATTAAAAYCWLWSKRQTATAGPGAAQPPRPAAAAGGGGGVPPGQASSITDIGVLTAVTQDGVLAKEVGPSVVEVVVTHPTPSLGYFPPMLTSFTQLSTIDLTGNRIIYIPATISNLQRLQVLKLSRNQINCVTAEVGQLAALTQLDLSHNTITKLPPAFCQLSGLKALNLMGNQLTVLPDEFGGLVGLEQLGLKSNALTALPPSTSRLTRLVELFLTDNQLTSLPEGFGSLSSLVKLQASFNPLTTLPPDFYHLPALELARFAVSNLAAWPQDLLLTGGLPRLSWCSLGGSPAASPVPPVPPELPLVEASALDLGVQLGDGASGEVFTGSYRGQPVAVKLFKGEVSPDGRTAEEVGIACAVSHPHLTRVLARVTQPEGLVLGRVEGRPLAAKPTSQHLLRCKWSPDASFSLPALLRIAGGVASALSYLHEQHIAHGDVYAHNVLVDSNHHATLCDFGASYCYPPSQAAWWQAMEVRGYGLLLHDLVERLEQQPQQQQQQGEAGVAPEVHQLHQLVSACCQPVPAARPTFQQVLQQLQA